MVFGGKVAGWIENEDARQRGRLKAKKSRRGICGLPEQGRRRERDTVGYAFLGDLRGHRWGWGGRLSLGGIRSGIANGLRRRVGSLK